MSLKPHAHFAHYYLLFPGTIPVLLYFSLKFWGYESANYITQFLLSSYFLQTKVPCRRAQREKDKKCLVFFYIPNIRVPLHSCFVFSFFNTCVTNFPYHLPSIRKTWLVSVFLTHTPDEQGTPRPSRTKYKGY